ncbi:MAG: SpoIIIAH-like family protein [Lachnospiraceae bacterium]|nr:SpoIIIAH-like family protein [Lachnospiraceae bacterium]
MKTIFKKNQLIITALAALIAVAGYLNHAERKINDDAKQAAANEAQSETTSTVENAEANESANTDVASGTEDIESNDVDMEGTPGEAIFVNASGTVDFIVEAKMAKEYARVSAQESLQSILDNQGLSTEEKQSAVDKMVELAEVSEREMAAENLIMAKGYSDVAVTMTDGYVDVIIVAEELDSSERAQVEDIVKRKMQVGADKITINAIEVKSSN